MSFWFKSQITRKRNQFREWLAAAGAEVLEPTNEWELVRFRAGGQTGIIYCNAGGNVTFVGQAEGAWEAFKAGRAWRAAIATKRKPKSSPRIQAIRARDGGHCFFCLLPVAVEDESEEHLVPVTAGGPNHITNLFLAHRVCNQRAGHLSAPEKIKLHVEAHMKAVMRIGEKPIALPGGQQYSTTVFKENGDPILLNADGSRSVFCDIDE